jgi:hypothetical protein
MEVAPILYLVKTVRELVFPTPMTMGFVMEMNFPDAWIPWLAILTY